MANPSVLRIDASIGSGTGWPSMIGTELETNGSLAWVRRCRQRYNASGRHACNDTQRGHIAQGDCRPNRKPRQPCGIVGADTIGGSPSRFPGSPSQPGLFLLRGAVQQSVQCRNHIGRQTMDHLCQPIGQRSLLRRKPGRVDPHLRP